MLSVTLFVLAILFAVAFGKLKERLQSSMQLRGGRFPLPPPAAAHATKRQSSNIKFKDIVQIIISLVLLVASLFIILSGSYDADHQKWAYGTVGTLIGFWLKG